MGRGNVGKQGCLIQKTDQFGLDARGGSNFGPSVGAIYAYIGPDPRPKSRPPLASSPNPAQKLVRFLNKVGCFPTFPRPITPSLWTYTRPNFTRDCPHSCPFNSAYPQVAFVLIETGNREFTLGGVEPPHPPRPPQPLRRPPAGAGGIRVYRPRH